VPVEVVPDRGISAANGDYRPDWNGCAKWLADGRISTSWCASSRGSQ
jgi:hypothetical protein